MGLDPYSRRFQNLLTFNFPTSSALNNPIRSHCCHCLRFGKFSLWITIDYPLHILSYFGRVLLGMDGRHYWWIFYRNDRRRSLYISWTRSNPNGWYVSLPQISLTSQRLWYVILTKSISFSWQKSFSSWSTRSRMGRSWKRRLAACLRCTHLDHYLRRNSFCCFWTFRRNQNFGKHCLFSWQSHPLPLLRHGEDRFSAQSFGSDYRGIFAIQYLSSTFLDRCLRRTQWRRGKSNRWEFIGFLVHRFLDRLLHGLVGCLGVLCWNVHCSYLEK